MITFIGEECSRVNFNGTNRYVVYFFDNAAGYQNWKTGDKTAVPTKKYIAEKVFAIYDDVCKEGGEIKFYRTESPYAGASVGYLTPVEDEDDELVYKAYYGDVIRCDVVANVGYTAYAQVTRHVTNSGQAGRLARLDDGQTFTVGKFPVPMNAFADAGAARITYWTSFTVITQVVGLHMILDFNDQPARIYYRNSDDMTWNYVTEETELPAQIGQTWYFYCTARPGYKITWPIADQNNPYVIVLDEDNDWIDWDNEEIIFGPEVGLEEYHYSYSATQCTITTRLNGTAINSSTILYYGEELTVDVTVNSGYSLKTLTCNGRTISNGSSIIVDGDVYIKAVAETLQYVPAVSISETVRRSGNYVSDSLAVANGTGSTIHLTNLENAYLLNYSDVRGHAIQSGDTELFTTGRTLGVHAYDGNSWTVKLYFTMNGNLCYTTGTATMSGSGTSTGGGGGGNNNIISVDTNGNPGNLPPGYIELPVDPNDPLIPTPSELS